MDLLPRYLVTPPPTPDNAVRKLIELMRKARTLGYSVVIPTYPPIIS